MAVAALGVSRPSHAWTSRAHSGSVSNSYGYIRAPWNNNPDEELTRHMSDVCGLEPINKPIPTCATHFDVLNLTSLGTYLEMIAGYGHGPMHVNTGGVFGACTGTAREPTILPPSHTHTHAFFQRRI